MAVEVLSTSRLPRVAQPWLRVMFVFSHGLVDLKNKAAGSIRP